MYVKAKCSKIFIYRSVGGNNGGPDCCGYYEHFNDVNTSYPCLWYMLPPIFVFFNFFLQMSDNFPSTGLLRPWLNSVWVYFYTIINGIVLLLSLPDNSLPVYKNTITQFFLCTCCTTNIVLLIPSGILVMYKKS